MNFQEKMFETTADLRARAAALANVAVTTARARAQVAAKRVDALKGSFAALTVAGRELNKVARRHAVRFVKENSTIAVERRQGRLRPGSHDLRDARQARPLPRRRRARRLPRASAPPARPPDLSPRRVSFGHATSVRPVTGRAAFSSVSSRFRRRLSDRRDDFCAAILLCLVRTDRHLKVQ